MPDITAQSIHLDRVEIIKNFLDREMYPSRRVREAVRNDAWRSPAGQSRLGTSRGIHWLREGEIKGRMSIKTTVLLDNNLL